MEPPRQAQPAQQHQPPPAPAPALPTAAAPAVASPASNGAAQPSAQPARPYLPGPPMSSAEKSLFPNSMPVRQLPGIHSFAPSPTPPTPTAPGHAASPPTGAAAAHPPAQSRAVSAGADQSQTRFGGASSYAGLTVASAGGAGSPRAAALSPPGTKATPTPPVLPPIASPAPPSSGTAAPARPPHPGHANAATATAAAPTHQQQQPPRPHQPPISTASNTSALHSRSNPMSVSSMLSGPPRAQPVSAYSPHSASSNGATSSTATPQPPVLPPDNRVNAAGEQKPAASPRAQPGSTLPAYASSLIAPTAAATPKPKPVEHPHQPGTPASAPSAAASAAARSAYPPLPSAFARENPYSPAAPSPAPSSGAGTPHQQQQQQQQAAAAALKNSLFPNLGSYRPAGSPTQPPSRAAQQSSSGASSGGSTPYQWQAQAAQQAQQVQQQQQRFGPSAGPGAHAGKAPQSARPGPATSNSAPAAPTLGATTRPGHSHGQQPQAQAQASAKAPQQQGAEQQPARFPPGASSSMDSYGAHARGPAGANGQAGSPALQPAAAPASQSGYKRRRSDAAERQSPFQRAKSGPAERATASPPPPASPAPGSATPLFTYAEWRKAIVRPPVVDVLNDAVDAWVDKYAQGEPRRFLGRVTYDALTPPAKLLDGELLAQNIGGYVEVVVPTSWVLGPHRTIPPGASEQEEIHSSCSVPPVDPHPVALAFGTPVAYEGEPLPFTSPTTPLVLPAHLADLPSLRQREVWGTDVYTDDSDVLAMLLHSGWLRVTRRERRLRAGEKGAGADAIRRARTMGEERITLPAAGAWEEVPPALLVRLGVVPALVRYEGIERQGIRSRSWGNGHDGVSLRIEDVLPLDDVPPPRAPRARKARAATCAHQIAALYRSAYPRAHAQDHEHELTAEHAHPPPPKRYRFAAPASSGVAGGAEGVKTNALQELSVTDTFVLDLGAGGRGRFVGLEREERAASEREERAQRMEVELA